MHPDWCSGYLRKIVELQQRMLKTVFDGAYTEEYGIHVGLWTALGFIAGVPVTIDYNEHTFDVNTILNNPCTWVNKRVYDMLRQRLKAFPIDNFRYDWTVRDDFRQYYIYIISVSK